MIVQGGRWGLTSNGSFLRCKNEWHKGVVQRMSQSWHHFVGFKSVGGWSAELGLESQQQRFWRLPLPPPALGWRGRGRHCCCRLDGRLRRRLWCSCCLHEREQIAPHRVRMCNGATPHDAFARLHSVIWRSAAVAVAAGVAAAAAAVAAPAAAVAAAEAAAAAALLAHAQAASRGV